MRIRNPPQNPPFAKQLLGTGRQVQIRIDLLLLARLQGQLIIFVRGVRWGGVLNHVPTLFTRQHLLPVLGHN